MSSTGPENTFIGSVHRHIPADVYHMKNHNPYNSGIADCWYSGNAGDLWIEYKFMELPARASTIVYLCKDNDPMLTILQQEWLEGRHDEGRRVGVIIGTPKGGVWLPELDWKKELTSGECKSSLIPRPALARMIANIVQHPS